MADKPTAVTVADALAWTTESLRRVGISNSQTESEWMLAAVLHESRSGVYISGRRLLTVSEHGHLCRVLQSRQTRRPLQQVLGQTDFYSLPLRVTPDVLVPRPETETLVDALVTRVQPLSAPWVLDLGTGSGAIAVALAHTVPTCRVVASDISEAPLRVAQENARRNDVDGRVRCLCGDLFGPIAGSARFHAIAANPPYIPSSEIASLQREVRDFEPRTALDGGPDGLRFFRRIARDAPLHLARHGWLVLEVGDGQCAEVQSVLRGSRAFFEPIVEKDLRGVERVILARSAAGAPPCVKQPTGGSATDGNS